VTPLFDDNGDDPLASLARGSLLVAFDFDGTLAPLVADRDRAAMRPGTRNLLASLCGLVPCAVISGRELRDVERRVEGIGVRHVVGNHGIEPSPGMERFERASAEARELLEGSLGGLGGLEFEDKRYSLSIHYRRSPDPTLGRAAIVRAVEALPVAARMVEGVMVVNVVPPGAPNKGEALLRLKRMEGADAAIYVGDDVTDEDAFALDRSGEAVGVRVGRCPRSAARYFLRDQREVDRLVARLTELRGPRRPVSRAGG
jgi:trehalose 6-phosphate phosphatase